MDLDSFALKCIQSAWSLQQSLLVNIQIHRQNQFALSGRYMFLQELFHQQMNKVNFPIQFDELLAKFKFNPLYEGTYKIDGVNIDTLYLNHPGYALGYKFHVNNKIVVYISDNEPFPTYPYPEPNLPC